MRRIVTLACVCLTAVACNGRLQAEAADARAPLDATAPVDVGIEDAGPDALICPASDGSPCSRFEACVIQALQQASEKDAASVPRGIWTAISGFDLLELVRQTAYAAGDCNAEDSPSDAGVISCDSYDPFVAAPPDASAMHYSNDLGQFVGLDGLDYVWTWLPDLEPAPFLLTRKQEGELGLYQAIVGYNQCAGEPSLDAGR